MFDRKTAMEIAKEYARSLCGWRAVLSDEGAGETDVGWLFAYRVRDRFMPWRYVVMMGGGRLHVNKEDGSVFELGGVSEETSLRDYRCLRERLADFRERSETERMLATPGSGSMLVIETGHGPWKTFFASNETGRVVYSDPATGRNGTEVVPWERVTRIRAVPWTAADEAALQERRAPRIGPACPTCAYPTAPDASVCPMCGSAPQRIPAVGSAPVA